MRREEIIREYNRWLGTVKDEELKKELIDMKDDLPLIEDAFYRHLSFGTGGLRGKLGAGVNRMNLYTVRRASLGLGKYLISKSGSSVAIGYDTRINSKKFAIASAEVLASLGIKVYLYSEPLPTPMLSYAVRELCCNAGIMITASHNPSSYNGYKVYGKDGCQITDYAAMKILEEIEKLDYFAYNEKESFDKLLDKGIIEFICEEIYKKYLIQVSELSVLYGSRCDKDISIVYTPLNGTGFRPVTDILQTNGYKNVTVVKEQATPDGLFPTCKKPNPELDEALEVGISYLRKKNADILIATDPDCDRVGVVVNHSGNLVHLNGNEVGILLLDYILSKKSKVGMLPPNGKCIKTIVTSPLANRIAEFYKVEIRSLLTGFKYIGEEIGRLEKENRTEDFIFGFEESCGYLGADFVRDKDGVYGALIISEMAAYYKAENTTLCDRLNEIYKTHGYFKSRLISYDFEGEAGAAKIREIMDYIRNTLTSVGGVEIEAKKDYKYGIDGLPASDVIELLLTNGDSVTVRPSGTEPKIKIYIFVTAKDEYKAEKMLKQLETSSELSFS